MAGRRRLCTLTKPQPNLYITKKNNSIADITLGVSAQNLFTLTKYKGLDPESSTTSSTSTGAVSDKELGLDYGSYPSARTFTFTIKLGF